jgi:threonine dehydratase
LEKLMFKPSLAELRTGQEIVYRFMKPTLAHAWPLLAERLHTKVVVKHENHTPAGAFKVRGGLTYFEALKKREPNCRGVISATRGNHGQSVGIAAKRHGMSATIVVPRGNSIEKNAAMKALGVNLIEHGNDFQESREFAAQMAKEKNLHMVPSYHDDLLLGVASYWLELFEASPDLKRVYVPIGMGSGACSAVLARDALGIDCEIIGVVSAHAQAYALSFAAGSVIEAPVTTLLADGLACRLPDIDALNIICAGVSRIVQVTDAEVAQAMRVYFSDTHNVSEGAGAAPLAAALQEQKNGTLPTDGSVPIGLPLCGGNVDSDVFAKVLGEILV